MAEDNNERSSEDLSEEASQFRIEELKSQGKVFQSRELTQFAALLCLLVTLYFFGSSLMYEFENIFEIVFSSKKIFQIMKQDSTFLFEILSFVFLKGSKIFLYIAIPSMLVGVCVSFIQIGPIFSYDPLEPNFEKINPIEGLKRFFTLKYFIESFRQIIKLIFLALVSFYLIYLFFLDSKSLIHLELLESTKVFVNYYKYVLYLVGMLGVFGAIDYALQRFEYRKQVRLNRQEAKQESKEHEGDPLIKARMRSIQRDASRKRMMHNVKTADVIITNPTHLAIAIRYEREKMNAPKVVAKGADHVAQKIKEIAKNNQVPMVENVPLARAMYKYVKVGHYIPKQFYQAVAEVLAYIYKLRRKAK